MELYEFHVGKNCAGAGGQHDALSEIAGRIGRGLVEATEAAGGENHPRCRQNEAAFRSGAGEASNRAVLCQQPAHFGAFKNRDRRCAQNGGGESPDDGRARTVALGVQDAPSAVGGLQPEDGPAIGVPVEAHPGLLQRLDDSRGGGNDIGGHFRIAETVSSGERIGKMQRDAVIGTEACGNAALRPGARRFAAKRTTCQKQHGLRRKCQRRHQAGNAAADDGRPVLLRQALAHTSSILSTARRAAAAMAGSTVTSWRFSSRAVRIFPSVMRFMCGQRLHGRINSTSG